MSNYEFKKPTVQLEKMLICPNCTETLSQIDISSFGACPYCDHALSATPELEDYLLKPAIDHWVSQQIHSNPIDFENLVLPDEEMFE